MNNNKVAVIGGGASGMLAAICAAEQEADVTIYERSDRVGKKILATGNGKCNLGNLDMDISNYNSRNIDLLSSYFEQFSVFDTIAFFESAGMMIREKGQGLYPASEQASTVLDILRMEIHRQHIKVECENEIKEIRKDGDTFTLIGRNKVKGFDKIILSCGSKAYYHSGEGETGYRLSKALGHSIVPVIPSLVQLHCREEEKKALAGVRAQAKVSLFIDGRCMREESGEVQFVNCGLSGIPVFQLSRDAIYALKKKAEVILKIDFLSQLDERAFHYYIRNRYETQQHKTLEEFLIGIANKKINQVIIKRSGYKNNILVSDIGLTEIKKIMDLYRGFIFHISGSNTFEQAQVCAGGIPLNEVTSHLESKKIPGLYITGELLDVDGRCGGYNLQWAWTSGYIAGVHAAGYVEGEL